MCVSLPARVLAVQPDDVVLVDIGGRAQRVTLLAVDDPVGPGDWLLVHSGFALARMAPEEARERLDLIDRAGSGPGSG